MALHNAVAMRPPGGRGDEHHRMLLCSACRLEVSVRFG